MNQLSLRKILAYSSINHISWMLASILFLKSVWINYFLTYTIINANIILIFHLFNIYKVIQLPLIINNNKLVKLIFIFNFFSLGGLPPFLGFYPKWIVLNLILYNNFYTLRLIIVILTLITLFFYIRLIFTNLTFLFNETSFLNIKYSMKSLIIFNRIILIRLIIRINLFNFL